MKIYTKTGDAGETSLFDNTRVSKADARVDAYGEVDELNACLGAARAAGVDDEIAGAHRDGSRRICSRWAPGWPILVAHCPPRRERRQSAMRHVERLEQAIDRLEETLPPLRRFILPGGSLAGALLHLARTVCRRAERRVIALGATPSNRAHRLPEPALRPAVRAWRAPSTIVPASRRPMVKIPKVGLWGLGFGFWDS